MIKISSMKRAAELRLYKVQLVLPRELGVGIHESRLLEAPVSWKKMTKMKTCHQLPKNSLTLINKKKWTKKHSSAEKLRNKKITNLSRRSWSRQKSIADKSRCKIGCAQWFLSPLQAQDKNVPEGIWACDANTVHSPQSYSKQYAFSCNNIAI